MMTRTATASPVVPSSGAQSPVSATDVRLTSGFWHDRQEMNTTRLLDTADRWIGSMGWYDAFRVAAGAQRTVPMQGKLFTDADVYKLLEAFAWEIACRPDAERERRLEELSALVADAQEEDGYLNTFFGPQGREARYRDLSHGHELYCAGHLFQAAVARLRSGAEDRLTETARRLADRICADFGIDGIDGSDGHPEVEVGLAELARATGEDRYLTQARRFVEGRGRGRFERHAIGQEYYLDDMPVREATVLRGHVVRAMYLTAAAVDLAVETQDEELLNVLETQWANTWARRTYLTGGMGSRHLGESFGRDFELPPDRAYAETCGAVGAIMVAWRLLLATGRAAYADAIERLLYNMVATHASAEGDRFFYVNPLLQREPGLAVPDGEAPFRKDTLRADWFWVACCPTNVARLLSSLGGYVATTTDDSLTIQQIVAGSITSTLDDGRTVGVELVTDYPWEGRVRLRIIAGESRWTLRIRVPEWAAGATVTAGDEGSRSVHPGYAEVTRTWRIGDEVVVDLPLDVRVNRADGRVEAIRGAVAIERGPLVYAAESVLDDADAVDLDRFLVAGDGAPEVVATAGPSDSRAAIVLHGVSAEPASTTGWPYAPGLHRGPAIAAETRLVPYYSWSNRGPSTMRVWIPTDAAPLASAIAGESTHERKPE